MTAVLLLPSPLLPTSAYEGLAAALRRRALPTAIAPAARDPKADGLIATWAALTGPGALLVAHSNAGYLAPKVRALADPAVRIVFMDAALPPESGQTRLAPAAFHVHLAALAEGGLLPPWTRWWSREDLRDVIPDDRFDELDRDCPRLPVSYFATQLTIPSGWVTAANAYLAFGQTYAAEVSFAAARGWPVETVDGGHLHFLADPDVVTDHILSLAEALPT